MNEKKKVLELISFSNFLDEPEFAEFVFNIICKEINDSQEQQPNASQRCSVNRQTSTDPHELSVSTTSTVSNFEDTKKKFERVVNLFNKQTKERKNFITNFHTLRPVFKTNNELLKILFRPKQNKDCDYDNTTTTFPTLTDGKYQPYPSECEPSDGEAHPFVTAALSAGWSAVSSCFAYRKNLKMEEKLQKAQTIIREQLDAFSVVCPWFTYLDEVKDSIDALIDLDVLKEMSQYLMKFFSSYKKQMNLDDCEFQNRLKDMLKPFVRKMKSEGKLKFGSEITPVALTFVFVFCLWQGQNRMIMESVMKAQILNRYQEPVRNSDVSVWEQVSEEGILVFKPLTKRTSQTPKSATDQEMVPPFGIQEGGNDDVQCPPLSKGASQTANSASAPKSLSEDTEKGTDVLAYQQSSIMTSHAFKSTSEQEMERFLNLGNAINLLTLNLLSLKRFRNPGFYLENKIAKAAEDFENAFLTIETFYNVAKHDESIPDTKVIPMIAIIVMSIPEDARQEDIKMAVKPLLPEEAWNAIKLQRMLTNENNWMVQVKPRHSQLLRRQKAIVIKEKSCAIIH